MALPTMRPEITGREFLRIAGGFGAPALGTSPAGGLDIDNAGNLATDGDITAQSITVENDVQQWSVEARADDSDKFIIRDVTNAQDVVEIVPNAGNVRMEVAATETVFNQAGLNVDHRIEGAADANLLFCDAGNDRVGIGTNAPGAKIHVEEVLSSPTGPLAQFKNGVNANNLTNVQIIAFRPGLEFIDLSGNGDDFRIGVDGNRLIISIDTDDDSAKNNSGHFSDVPNAFVIDAEGKVGLGVSAATDVLLDLSSTTAAFRPPSMTTTQRDLLTALAGMMIYNTTTNTVQFYNGSTWATI